MREKVGSQDQIASTFGGFNSIEFKNKNFTVKKIVVQKNNRFGKMFLLVNTEYPFFKVIEKEKLKILIKIN